MQILSSLIARNFNYIIGPHKKMGSRLFVDNSEFKEFREFIGGVGLIGLELSRSRFI